MKFKGYIATSLDGYIARQNGELDWLEREEWADPDGSDYGFKSFMSSLDAMVMGKNTFLKVLEIGQWIYGDLPVYIASSTLLEKDIPSHLAKTVKPVNGTATEIAQRISDMGKKNIYVDGGMILQNFIREGILNELTVTVMPILIGTGIPLFGSLDQDVKVKLLSTVHFKSGVVQNYYEF